jgi:intein/homing endonuclease
VSDEKSQSTTSVLTNGRKISGTTFRRDCYSKPLWILLKALGAPNGDKTVAETRAPDWIKNGSKIVSREFLAAYFGSEMTTPKTDKRDGKTFLQPSFSLNKASALLGNGLEFVEDVKELLSRFGARVSHVKIVEGIKRKDGTTTKKIKVMLSSELENALALYGIVGFAYSPRKQMLSRFAYEYLLTKKTLLNARAEAREQVLKQASVATASAQELSETHSVTVREHDVKNWLKKTNKGVRVSEKDFPTFQQWIGEHAICEDGLVWETINSIKKVECPDVRDVTTLEDEHNFFANGFLTGNCGLVKNLALFCEVTTGTEEKRVENTLKKLGVSMRI